MSYFSPLPILVFPKEDCFAHGGLPFIRVCEVVPTTAHCCGQDRVSWGVLKPTFSFGKQSVSGHHTVGSFRRLDFAIEETGRKGVEAMWCCAKKPAPQNFCLYLLLW